MAAAHPPGLDFDRQSTVDTWDTSSTATTVWGPGTLSGRAIKALGDATLRGVEKLIIRWKLATINSNLPHKSPDAPLEQLKLEKIYDDVLELSRLDVYDDKVRHKALRLIMMQIGSRETSQLTKCVVKWPIEEIQTFLSELMPCMPLLWHYTEDAPSLQVELISVYSSSQSTESHEIVPFIDFLRHLVVENEDACQAVLLGGFLDLLIALTEHYALDFGASDGEWWMPPSITDACNTVLMECLLYPNKLRILSSEPKSQLLWPNRPRAVRLALLTRILTNFSHNLRRDYWRNTHVSKAMERISEIEVILSYHNLSLPINSVYDICFDLMEFSATLHYRHLTRCSLPLMLKCIAIGEVFWDALRRVFTVCSYDEVLDLLYQVIYPLGKWPSEDSQVASIFAKEVEEHHPGTQPIDHFVDFGFTVADNALVAQALIDAEVIGLFRTSHYHATSIAKLQQLAKT